MRPVILYRNSLSLKEDEREREAAAAAGFTVLNKRAEVQKDDFVVGRYSCVPFYREFAADIEYVGATLINSVSQHNYIADLQNWVVDLREMTPETWSRLEDLPDEGSFVLKGSTNSRKHDWDTMMFAKDKRAAIEVHSRLCADGLIGYQDIFIRRYEPLTTYMVGIKNLPITKEFRFFVYKGQIVSGGYYWSSHVDELETIPSPSEVPEAFLQEAISRIGNSATFYTIDVAQKINGEWIVIELNDGQQAGPSENDIDVLYKRLFESIQCRK